MKCLAVYEEFRPSSSISDLVDLFFTIRQTRCPGQESHTELIVPDGTLGLLFVNQGSLQRSCLKGTIAKLQEGYVFGQKTKSVYYEFNSGQLDVFGAKLRPGAMMELFGVSPEDLTDTLAPIQTLMGAKMHGLEEQIALASDAPSRIRCLEQYMQEARREKGDRAKLLEAILSHITRLRGDISVKDLALHFQLGYKRLERLFKSYIGLTPKQFCRIIRFNATLYYQKQQRVVNLTDLAYTAGYFDQMHFIKEVKSITDLPPSRFYKYVGQEITPLHRRHIAAKYAG